jgi:hypothetical protein
MKHVMTLTFAALSFLPTLVACSSDPPPSEPKGSTSSHLSVSDCMQGIQAPIGSAEWQAEIRQCAQAQADEAKQTGGAHTPSTPNVPDVPATPPTPSIPDVPSGDGSGQGQSCTSGIQCINGNCSCTSGPNKGQSCDGASTGPDGCSAICNYCQ